MSGIKRFLGDTVIYGFSTVVSRLLSFLLTPIIIRKLRKAADYGVYTNLYAWVSMINAILAFGMETTYFRYIQKVEAQDKPKVFNTSFLITVLTSCLLVLSLWIFTPSVATWFAPQGDHQDYAAYIYFFTGILVADALAVVPFAKLRAEGKALRYGLLKLINVLIAVGFNLLFLFVFPDLLTSNSLWQSLLGGWYSPEWILGNVFLANLIASISTLLMLLPQIAGFRLRVDKKLLTSMLKYSFPILIANISFIINEHLDKMMFPKLISGERGIQDLGIYGAIAKIAVFLNLFVTAFRLGSEPFFFSYAKNENARLTYAKIMEYFVLVMVIIMVGISANMNWLKYFISTEDPAQQTLYWSGLIVLPVLLFNNVLLGIYMNLSIWYKLSDQTRYALYISVIGATITIVLNILLIPRYSFIGAALSTTAAYLIMISLSYRWGQQNYVIPYSTSKIVIYLIVGLTISCAMNTLLDYNFWYCNGIWLIFMGIIAFLENGNVKQFLRKKS